MTIDPSALLAAEPPPTAAVELAQLDWTAAAIGVGALVVSGLFATMRLALRQSHVQRVLAAAPSDGQRARLGPLLEQAEPLATSASVLSIGFRLFFVVSLFKLLAGEDSSTLDVAITLAVAVPLHWLATEGIPLALAKRYGDAMLLGFLVPFHLLQIPVSFVAHALEAVRRGFLRIFGLQDNTHVERQIVEGLRDVIAESEIDEDLDETEREIIGNVLELGDVDVAAVMTPRTEVAAVSADDDLIEATREVAATGHSRIPVYEGNLDTIIGTLSARHLVKLAAAGELESARLRDHVQPAYFVPETKEVSELLSEMRRERQKMAIVLDEYGGTAGLVTLTDILEELVGDLHDEFDDEEPAPIRRLPDGLAEVDAGLHVTEVNEELGLDLPEEEDFETLAGFVLSELGRFPKAGESFEHQGHEFAILEANDRRVLKVSIRLLARDQSA